MTANGVFMSRKGALIEGSLSLHVDEWEDRKRRCSVRANSGTGRRDTAQYVERAWAVRITGTES